MSNEKPLKPDLPAAERKEPAKLVSLQRSRAIGKGLRDLYGGVVDEPVPDAFLAILEEADEKAAAEGKDETLPPDATAKIFVLGARISGPKK